MRLFLASLLCLIVGNGSARADFAWLGAWQSSVSLTQSPPSSVASAVFNVTSDTASSSTLSIPTFATEDGTAAGFAENASTLVSFSRTFQVTGNPTELMLTGGAHGILSVNFPVPALGGNAQSIYSLQLAVSGTAGNLIDLGSQFTSPTSASSAIGTDVSNSVLLSAGTYTLSGQAAANAVKTSGLSAATVDFSSGNGLVIGVQAVPEPGSIALMSFGLAIVGLGFVRHRRRLESAEVGCP